MRLSGLRPAIGFLLSLAAGTARAQTPAPADSSAAAKPGVRLTGYLQARETYREGVGLTASINRARLAAYGTPVKDVTWRLQGEFRTGSTGTGRASVSLQDAYVRYQPERLGLQAGQFKTPFAREFITSLADVETADRAAVVDSLAPKRDIGIQVDYTVGTVAGLALGVFNGEGQNTTANSDSALLWVGRASARPVAHLTLGANVARYGSDSTRYGIDGSIELRRAALRAEYIGQHRDGGGLDDKGWYAQAAYRIRPSVQLVLKQEEFRRSAVSEALRNRATSVGVNVELGKGQVRLLANYVSRKLGTPGVRRGQLITQAQVKF